MGARMRALDWSNTPLGPVDAWPQSLRSTVSMLLPSKAQIILFWGPEFVVLYNDAYRPVFGAKHPHALGLPGPRGVERDLGQHAARPARRRRPHRRGVLGEGPAVRARAPRVSGGDLLRRVVRPGARGVGRGRRRVLHRHRNDRARRRRAAPGVVEGASPSAMPPRARRATPACWPRRRSPRSRRTSCSRSRIWATSSRAARPEREEQLAASKPRTRQGARHLRRRARTRRPADWSSASIRGARSTISTARSSISSPTSWARRSPTRARTKRSDSAPKRWRSSIARRRRSSATSATSSGRR